jgi:hypothetical protein
MLDILGVLALETQVSRSVAPTGQRAGVRDSCDESTDGHNFGFDRR